MKNTPVRFDSRKTSRRVADVIQFLGETKEKCAFVEAVRELADRKMVSEEGEFSEFVITDRDVTQILKSQALKVA
jgi:hypothetical protein